MVQVIFYTIMIVFFVGASVFAYFIKTKDSKQKL